MNIHLVRIHTADGTFTARFSATGLAGLEFPRAGRGRGRQPAAPKAEPAFELRAGSLPAPLNAWSVSTAQALAEALAGKKPRQLPPIDLSGGTTFQRRVWAALSDIPHGQTRTYAQIAAAIGQPKAARAVGRACGANPVPVLIPCHRVQAAGGRLGGFTAGLAWKRRLLAREKRPAEALEPPAPEAGERRGARKV